MTNYQILHNTQWITKDLPLDILEKIAVSIDSGKDCEIIRSGYFKKVLKYTHNQASFYIKQYTTRHFRDAIKSLFSLSKARKEWNKSHELLKNHMLTAEPVAVGEKRHFGILKDCYIISKAIPNTLSVKELLLAIQQSPSGYNPSQKNLLVKNLIFYVKTMHDCGIFHGELHAENILVNPNDATVFYLLDLGRTQFTKKLPLSWRIQELSRLAYSISDTCTNEEIKELITYYTNQPTESKDREIFHKTVFKEVSSIKRRLWHSRAKKCFKNNNIFTCTTHGNYKIHTRNEWEVNKLIDLIRNHNFSVKENFPGALKISAKIAITRLPASHETTESVCIKEYKYPSSFKRFLYSFCNSPARKAWFAAHGLIALNVKTPKPIALLEEKRFGILRRSFIVTEDITTSLPCNKYISEMFHNPYDKTASGKKRIFLSCLAASFRQLHDSGIYHRDLKANNIMIMELRDTRDNSSPPPLTPPTRGRGNTFPPPRWGRVGGGAELLHTWDFFYLDLDRVCFDKKITLTKKIKNLSQLNSSLSNCITYTDRLRFYRAYAGVESLDSENKRILQTIIQLSLHRKHVWNPKIHIPQVSQIN